MTIKPTDNEIRTLLCEIGDIALGALLDEQEQPKPIIIERGRYAEDLAWVRSLRKTT